MSNDARKSWIPPGLVPTGTPSAAPMEPVGLEASWEQCREEAARVDPRDVVSFKPNASVVLHNVRTGVAAVLAERAWFEAQPDGPRVDFARVAGAETAAEALVFVATRAGAITRVAPGVRAKIVRARTALRVLRGGAESLVAAGVLTAAEVPSIDGRGPLATARACVAYASLFRAKQAQTRHLTAVKPEHVREAAALGTELLRDVKPRGVGGRAARPEVERAAADDRDRMAVVVTRRYDYVERVAAWRWGRDCEAIAPTMLARDVSRADAPEEELDDEALDADDEEALDEGSADEDVAADDEESTDEDGEDEPVAQAPATPPKATARKPAAAPKTAPKADARKTTKR